MVGFKRTLTLNVVGRISAIQFAGPSVSKVAFDPNIKINHPKDNQGSPNKKNPSIHFNNTVSIHF